MQLMNEVFKAEVLDAVLNVAQAAGESIMQVYDSTAANAMGVSSKADDSPLTVADLAAHHCIVDHLKTLTPHIAVVSEEDKESHARRASSGTFWLIDPLDGTKEFIARNGEFTVNIALVVDGFAQWGVVYAPALAQLYWGGRGMGAWRKQSGETLALRVSAPVADGGTYRVVASKSHLNEATSALIARLGKSDLVQAGSSLKFCRIAEGLADVYPRLAPTCEWDTAAAQAVVEGAGGHVFDLAGNRLCYGKQDILNPDFVAASVPADALAFAL